MNLESYRIKPSTDEYLDNKRKNFRTVKEKIILEKSDNEHLALAEGPTVDLFFHELISNESKGKLIFDKSIAFIGFLLLVILYPVIALGIKLTSKGPVLTKQRNIGFRGNYFDRYFFRTKRDFPDFLRKIDPDENPHFPFGKLLEYSGIKYLPNVINILKGEMSFVGPRAYSDTISTYWNNRFSQFYKRYATRPGIISPGYSSLQEHITDEYEYMKKELSDEFSYLTYPTLKKDLEVIKRRIKS